MNELLSIPGVGVKIAEGLALLGINKVNDLKGRDPEDLYTELCIRRCLSGGLGKTRCSIGGGAGIRTRGPFRPNNFQVLERFDDVIAGQTASS